MELISYATFKKRYWDTPEKNGFKFCGEDYDYNLFEKYRPKEIAKKVIKETFAGKDIENYTFVYIPRYYRGRNNLQDRIYVYYKEKQK